MKRKAPLAAISCVALCSTGAAQAEPVDVELFLAVDVSGSMRGDELRLQRDGYVAALRSPEVVRAIEGGLHGKVAVTYVEWARDTSQKVIVPWRVIATQADADAFAKALLAAPVDNMRNTSISGAIATGQAAFRNNGFEGDRLVIDVSGDGPNNQGAPVNDARDAALAEGISINGLPIKVNGWPEGRAFGFDGLESYYKACVTGGPLSFVIPVADWQQFPMAVRQKLVLELSGRMPDMPARVVPAQAAPLQQGNGEPDCQVGEKLRRISDW
ncbi:MAG: DUF1194 domain-containing protein [Phyllobacteriaceae bacterium]|nr:DUF1194 domain-containing protein [Phyllobacteriaceae bacterium]